MKRLNTEEIKKERKPKEPRIKMLPDEDAGKNEQSIIYLMSISTLQHL